MLLMLTLHAIIKDMLQHHCWLCTQVLSDYIVKNRGILPGSARDAYDQYREVESIVMSTYKACVETDTEGDNVPFTAQVQGSLTLHQQCLCMLLP